MPKLLSALALALLAGSLVAVPAAGAEDRQAARPKKVVVFGTDGALLSHILTANTPNLKALITSGFSSRTTLYAQPLAPTLSGPGWSTNATGVWPDKHKVTSNSWGRHTNLSKYPDFLTRVENADPSRSTYAIADWTPLTTDSAGQAVFSAKIDSRVTHDGDALGWPAADARVAADAAARLKADGTDASFVYFGNVDIVGHAHGAASAQYQAALEQLDGFVGQVVGAVKSRPTYADEDWTFIVTTDHGHTDAGGHGGSSPAERSSFIIASGPGLPTGTPAVAPKNVDILPTVLTQLGLTVDPAWGLDGRPLGASSGDPFDSLSGALKPRVDETGVPAGVLGWTQQAPAGWRIDNTGLGAGGVTEWRGWSFSTDDFWTRAAPDQQRESNVRARGVFAVADSDEWADKPYTGTFNSRLVSPAYDVSGASLVRIGFSSHYLKEGGETASVAVSFDGAAARTVKTYTGDVIARNESLEVAVPAGAQRVVVTWSLTNGSNNWYWAVDAPRVTKAG